MSTKVKRTRKELNHDYYMRHKEEHAQYMAQYFKDNRDKWNDYQRDKVKEYMRNKRSTKKKEIDDSLTHLNNIVIFEN
jgi:hypothetical protein